MRGTESDVAGMISATSSMKTVRESNTVMPARKQRLVSVLAVSLDQTTDCLVHTQKDIPALQRMQIP